MPFLKQGAFDVQGLVSIPFAKLERRLGRLTSEQMHAVDTVLRTWLSLGASNTGSGA